MKSFVLILVVLISSQSFAADKMVRFAATEWCPYTCSEMPNQGIVAEYIRALLIRHHIQMTVEFLPWSRAVNQVKQGKLDGLLTAVHSEAPGLSFTSTPTADYRSCFINVRNEKINRPRKYLYSAKIGISADYGYGAEIDAIISTLNKKNIIVMSGQNTIDRLIKLNNNHRIDFFVEEEFVAAYAAQKVQLKLSSAKCGEKNPFYLAFNPTFDKDNQVIKLLNDEISNSQDLFEVILKENSLDRID